MTVTVVSALVAFTLPECSKAQRPDPIHISVTAEIVARPASRTRFGIEILPAEAVPKRTFVSLRGLPAAVSLTEGHTIGPGSWIVPVDTLGTLAADIPEDASGRSDIIISLISMEGSLLAVARTTLVVERPTASAVPQERPPPVPNPGHPPAASAAAEPVTAEPPDNRAHVPPPAAGTIAGGAVGEGTSTAPPQELSTEARRLAERLLAQGERYLAQADVVSARLVLRRAAETGLAAAAMRLAGTYDPVELSRTKMEGVGADQAEARKWYERARSLGAPEAEERLARLDARK